MAAYNATHKGALHPLAGRVGANHPSFGRTATPEWCEQHSAAMSGERNPMHGGKLTAEQRATASARMTGENNPWWRGGQSQGFRYGPDWDAITSRIKERDGYRCQYAGCRRTEHDGGRHLEVHHIKPIRWCASREEANRDDNLTTYCRSHHMRVERLLDCYVPLCIRKKGEGNQKWRLSMAQ